MLPLLYGVRSGRFLAKRTPKESKHASAAGIDIASVAREPAPDSGTASGGQARAPQQPDPAPQRIPRWLVRVELLLRVMLRIYIGLGCLLRAVVAHVLGPEPLFVQFPTLSIYAANGAVRGIVSGLGLLNIWIALRDAMQYRSRE